MKSELTRQITTFDNGLTLVVVPMEKVHRVVIDAHLRVGPRYESAENNGVSHFLEHMLYRGTPRHPSSHEQALAFESLGGTLVAATYVDHGTMAIAVPPESLSRALPLFCEVFRSPVFDGMDIEKGIVREEILEGLDESGTDVDPDNLVRQLAFGEHPLGYPITGSIEHVERMTEPLLHEHHGAHYVGDNTVLTVAGPVNAADVEAQVRAGLGPIARGGQPRSPAVPEQTEARFRHVRHQGSQTAVRVAFRAPGDHDPGEPATEMLLRVLDDGMSTRLYHRICDSRGLCYDVSAAYEAYAEGGLFDIAAESEHERAPEVLDEVFGLMKDLAAQGPTAEELDKAKTRYAWQLQELLDDPAEAAEFFGFGMLTGVARTPAERLAELSDVSTEDVRRAAEHMVRRASLSVVTVGLLSKKLQARVERAVSSF